MQTTHLLPADARSYNHMGQPICQYSPYSSSCQEVVAIHDHVDQHVPHTTERRVTSTSKLKIANIKKFESISDQVFQFFYFVERMSNWYPFQGCILIYYYLTWLGILGVGNPLSLFRNFFLLLLLNLQLCDVLMLDFSDVMSTGVSNLVKLIFFFSKK